MLIVSLAHLIRLTCGTPATEARTPLKVGLRFFWKVFHASVALLARLISALSALTRRRVDALGSEKDCSAPGTIRGDEKTRALINIISQEERRIR